MASYRSSSGRNGSPKTEQLADRFRNASEHGQLNTRDFFASQASQSGSEYDHSEDDDEDWDDGNSLQDFLVRDDQPDRKQSSPDTKAFRDMVVKDFALRANASRRKDENRKDGLYEQLCSHDSKSLASKRCSQENSLLKEYGAFFTDCLNEQQYIGLSSSFVVEDLLGNPGGFILLPKYRDCANDIDCYCRALKVSNGKSGKLYGFYLYHKIRNKCISNRVVTDVRPGVKCPAVTLENFLVGTYDVAVVMLSFLRHVYLSRFHKTVFVYNVVGSRPTLTKQLESEIVKCLGFKPIDEKKQELHFNLDVQVDHDFHLSEHDFTILAGAGAGAGADVYNSAIPKSIEEADISECNAESEGEEDYTKDDFGALDRAYEAMSCSQPKEIVYRNHFKSGIVHSDDEDDKEGDGGADDQMLHSRDRNRDNRRIVQSDDEDDKEGIFGIDEQKPNGVVTLEEDATLSTAMEPLLNTSGKYIAQMKRLILNSFALSTESKSSTLRKRKRKPRKNVELDVKKTPDNDKDEDRDDPGMSSSQVGGHSQATERKSGHGEDDVNE